MLLHKCNRSSLLGSFLLRLCVRWAVNDLLLRFLSALLKQIIWEGKQSCWEQKTEGDICNLTKQMKSPRQIHKTHTGTFNSRALTDPETGLRHAEGLWHSGTSPSSAVATQLQDNIRKNDFESLRLWKCLCICWCICKLSRMDAVVVCLCCENELDVVHLIQSSVYSVIQMLFPNDFC